MVKGHMLYVKNYDASTQAINASTSIQGRGLHIPQQSATDHTHSTGQDKAWQGTLSPYLNECGAQVKVGGKAARPYRPP
jgi:hypothetical protein